MNNKTPVSILQELMQKKKINPQYVLTYDGTRTQNITFTYQVTCDGFVKTGSGRSKKDAKHNAAKAVLEAIDAAQTDPTSELPANSCKRKISSTEDSCLPKKARDSSPLDIPKALQQACTFNNLPIPEYKIKRVGPIFSVECVVSSFREEAAAETVEEAKHEAARKAWAKLQINFEKSQCLKNKEEKFDDVVRSAESLLQSFSEVNPMLPEPKNEGNCSVLTEVTDTFEKAGNVPFVNTVDVLNQMCIDINLQKPTYEYTIVGPTFAQIFTVKCTVSTFKKEGVAKIKKEAKREAARKMIEKIQSAVRKLQNSDKLDLQSEEAKFFVTGTVIAMLETIAAHQTHSELPSSRQGFFRMEDEDSCVKKEKIKSKNAIRALRQLCKDNNLQDPEFEVQEEKLFYSVNYTVTCVVSTFKEGSMGPSVEDAKQKAATKMLDKFTKLQNSYLEQLICSVRKLDYRNPSRWKSQLKNIEL